MIIVVIHNGIQEDWCHKENPDSETAMRLAQQTIIALTQTHTHTHTHTHTYTNTHTHKHTHTHIHTHTQTQTL